MKQSDMVADVIRNSVSALDAGRALGLSPDRYGRCACPIHNGSDRNMRLFTGDKGYFCFVCHSGGDVIDLVQRTMQCGFTEAVKWLSDAFNLNVSIHKPVSAETLRRAENAARRRKEMAAREAEMARDELDLWLDAGDLYATLLRWQSEYAPERPWDRIDKRYAAACRYIHEARELLYETEDIMGERNGR